MKVFFRKFRDSIVTHGRIVFPILIVACVAATVAIALKLNNNKEELESDYTSIMESIVVTSTEETVTVETEDVPLEENVDGGIYSLIATYYNAGVIGDRETLESICDGIAEQDLLCILEYAKYVSAYPVIEIYTKPGLNGGETLVFVYYELVVKKFEDVQIPGYQAFYVVAEPDGTLKINNSECTDEVNEYIKTVSAQDDVVEFNNRVNVDFNELMAQRPEIFEYLTQMTGQVSTAVGITLAQNHADEQPAEVPEEIPSDEIPDEVEEIIIYARPTTTVNVRSSDSEKADKLGKATAGSRIQVMEQRVNGWTKVMYDGKEGYIKSEYLALEENLGNLAAIGTVKTKANVNVRSGPGENYDRIGALTTGTVVDLFEDVDGWCKINYDGMVAYVKADFVDKQ